MVLYSASAKTALVIGAVILAALPACGASRDRELEESAGYALSSCGNGVREAGEHCDDGNASSLDACSSTCTFEQTHRVKRLEMQFDTDAFCTANAIGRAWGDMARSGMNEGLASGVADGSISILFAFGNLGDLGGTNASNLVLGSLHGNPVQTPGYDGHRDLDWWYTPVPGQIDNTQAPVAKTTAGITNKVLSAGPGNVAFAFTGLAGDTLTSARMRGTIGSSSKPSAGGGHTGHLASENLDPNLETFESITGGQICGNVSAAALATMPVDPQIQSQCSQGYSATNTMLDAFTSGCRVFFVNVINAIQPDQQTADVPPVGAGGPYKLSADGNKRVSKCQDKNGATVDLAACLKAASYSIAFRFDTNRVVLRK